VVENRADVVIKLAARLGCRGEGQGDPGSARAFINAATIVAEIGDSTRFSYPRRLMAYVGLVPSEHFSGDSVRRGGITKAGYSQARRAG